MSRTHQVPIAQPDDVQGRKVEREEPSGVPVREMRQSELKGSGRHIREGPWTLRGDVDHNESTDGSNRGLRGPRRSMITAEFDAQVLPRGGRARVQQHGV